MRPADTSSAPPRSAAIDTLLHVAGLLRQRYVRPSRFNLFTTLRSASDEVRLHSRFLAALLDPQAHSLGTWPLGHFLSRIGVQGFDLEGIRVERERFNVDILVTNSRRQALVIENKINAGDQPEQLQRYYQSVQASGCAEVHLCYLSLDGRDPAEDSLGDLASLGEDGRPGSYASLGYASDILPWLQQCLRDAALDPPLRESIAQYHDLISQLTGHDMQADHLSTLADTLLQGDNLLAAHDIQLAYSEALIALQVRLWQELRETIERDHPAMAGYLSADSFTDEDLPALCRNFVYQSRNNKGYGLFYRIPGYEEAYASFEMDYAISLGIYCDKTQTPDDYHTITTSLDDNGESGNRNEWWPTYAFYPQAISLKTPSAEELKTLNDPQRRRDYVQAMADEVGRLWHVLARRK